MASDSQPSSVAKGISINLHRVRMLLSAKKDVHDINGKRRRHLHVVFDSVLMVRSRSERGCDGSEHEDI